jgi:hypothetical protein
MKYEIMELESLLGEVSISREGIKKLSEVIKEEDIKMPDWNIPQLPDFGNRILNFQFLTFINSMNFCFIESDERERWRNKKTGEYGAFGVFAALSDYFRTIVKDNMLEYRKLGEVDLEKMEEIFAGDENYGKLPLLDERVKIFHELSENMERFPFEQTRFTRDEFIGKLVESFPSYSDFVEYKGMKIEMMKRAQLLMGMLMARGIVEIEDPDNIDLFADYRVPQVLREFGILVYSDELIEKLKRREFLSEGGRFESEIRIATIVAGRLIKNYFETVGKKINCVELDYFLWIRSRNLDGALEFHRTYSIKY